MFQQIKKKEKEKKVIYHNKLINYFQVIPFAAKLAWLVFGLAKIFGVFSIILLFAPGYIYLIRITLPMWIILLIISIILALYSRKNEPDLKEWWRYYRY